MSSQPLKPKKERNAPIWIKAFVVFHLVAITMWSLPYPKRPYQLGTAKFEISTRSPADFARSFSETVTQGILYLNWRYLKLSPLMYYPGATGFWQYWDMFSPDPASVDLFMDAEVTYKDGSVFKFNYPRIYSLPLPTKYLKERYRKFFENVNSAEGKSARPYVAQRIALESFRDPANPPIKVVLFCNAFRIAPPGQPQPSQYSRSVLGEFVVNQATLLKDKEIGE